MNLTVPCVQCNRQLLVRDEFLGRQVRCPACGHVQTAATTDEVPAPAPPERSSGPIIPPRSEEVEAARPPVPREEEDRWQSGRRRTAPLPYPDEPTGVRRGSGSRGRRGDYGDHYCACPYCDEPILPRARHCRWCNEDIDEEWLYREQQRMGVERQRSLTLAASCFAIAVVLVLLSVVGAIVAENAYFLLLLLVAACPWVGAGCYFVQFKGQNPYWGLLALLVYPYFVGPIILLCMRDKKGRGIQKLQRFLQGQ